MYITYMQQTFIHETMLGNGEKNIRIYMNPRLLPYFIGSACHWTYMYMTEWALTTITVNFVKKMFGVGSIFNLFIYLFFSITKKGNPHYSTPSLGNFFIYFIMLITSKTEIFESWLLSKSESTYHDRLRIETFELGHTVRSVAYSYRYSLTIAFTSSLLFVFVLS